MGRRLGGIRPSLRTGVIAGAVAFLTLVGSSTATALWSASTSVEPFTADAATVAVSHTVGTGLSHTYTASTLTAAQAVMVTNTGNREAAFSVTVNAASSSDLRTHVTARLAVVPSAAACTPSATLASPAAGTLTSPVTLSGAPASLAAGASVIVCVQTAMSTVTGHGGKSLTGSVVSATIAAPQPGWSASTSATTFTQSVTAGGSTIEFEGNARYWIRNALSFDHCISTRYHNTSNNTPVWQFQPCGDESNWQSVKNQMWRFFATDGGYYRVENVNAERNLGAQSATTGAEVRIQNSSGHTSQWAFIDNGDGTVLLQLRADTSLCLAINGPALAALEGAYTHLASCNGAADTQRFVLDMLEIVVPPPITLRCTNDAGYNVYFAWDELVGYQADTRYRIFINDQLLSDSGYGGASGWHTVLHLQSSNATLSSVLANNGYGAVTITVQQSVLDGPWTTTGTGPLLSSPSHPRILCG